MTKDLKSSELDDDEVMDGIEMCLTISIHQSTECGERGRKMMMIDNSDKRLVIV